MGLDFIYTDKHRYKELGYVKHGYIDMAIGKYSDSSNDFSLKVPLETRNPLFDVDSMFYCPGTEWGGIVEYLKINTKKNEITYKGSTFRGILSREYVQPADGESHLLLSGDANTCLNSLVEGKFDGLFVVDDIGASGVHVHYKIRYLNLLDAVEKMLDSGGAKLLIYYNNLDSKVHLKATPIQDLSELIQYDNDYQIYMTVETKPKQYNHVLALGQGELAERIKINRYLQEDGSWGDTEFYSGLDKKSYKYENVNAVDETTLMAELESVIAALSTTETLDISFEADEVELFDIVGAKEQITGVSFKQAVVGKILKGQIGQAKIEYNIGETGSLMRSTINNNISQTEIGPPEPGATFYPNVSDDCELSWTNDRGLPNPKPVNIKGNTGKGIATVVLEYYLSTSNESLIGGSWSESVPTWKRDTYLWMRFKITYNNPFSVTYSSEFVDSSWDYSIARFG